MSISSPIKFQSFVTCSNFFFFNLYFCFQTLGGIDGKLNLLPQVITFLLHKLLFFLHFSEFQHFPFDAQESSTRLKEPIGIVYSDNDSQEVDEAGAGNSFVHFFSINELMFC